MNAYSFLWSPAFYDVKDKDAFFKGVQQAISSVNPAGIFAADNLITFSRNLGFLGDEAFAKARATHATTAAEIGVAWRHHILVWAARSVVARGVPGDFVECACYKGTSARIVCDMVDLEAASKCYYLYDLFQHDESMAHHAMPEHSVNLFQEVKDRFAKFPRVRVNQGCVPEVLDEICPELIAFLHLDLNSAPAEIGALERLFDRMSPGAILVLDDYGWAGYKAQQVAEDAWLGARGYQVLELPTGQGLVFK